MAAEEVTGVAVTEVTEVVPTEVTRVIVGQEAIATDQDTGGAAGLILISMLAILIMAGMGINSTTTTTTTTTTIIITTVHPQVVMTMELRMRSCLYV